MPFLHCNAFHCHALLLGVTNLSQALVLLVCQLVTMCVAIDGRRSAILLFKKFYEMRCVGEGTFDTDLRYRF